MGGFAGFLRLDGAPLDRSAEPVLDAMGMAISHRGLATRQVCRRGALGLVLPAELKLSGLSKVDEDLLVAFDGRSSAGTGSKAATELGLLYRKHGLEMAHHIEGRFAFCVWDAKQGTLLLARDRLGIQPLFHAVVRAGTRDALLLFGSELKAVLAHPDCPREVDWLAALSSMAMPRRTFPRTSFFRGIEHLGAGTLLLADTRRGTLHPQTSWSVELPAEEVWAADRRSDAEIIDGYRDALEAAVDETLGPDAESTGLLLSGGIDSVSIAALAARRVRLPTFTVLGQSTFGNGDAGLAHRAAAALGLPVHPVLFRWDEVLRPEHWRRLLWLTETPYCGPQHYYKFHLHRHAMEACPGLTQMLTGEGSDELSGADFRNQSQARDEASFEDYIADLSFKQRDDLQCLETVGVEEWMGQPVFTREFLAQASGRPLPAHPWHRRIRYVLEGMEKDVLWRDDRLAAGCGMGSDAPFMNPRLLEYVMRIPPRAYPTLYLRKRMLRDAMAGIVPDFLRAAPKIPFYGGVDSRYTSRLIYSVLMAEDQALVREALGEGPHPVVARDLVEKVLQDCAGDPQRGSVHVLLLLVNLGLLEKMARDAAARPGPAAEMPVLPEVREWDDARIAAELAGDAVTAGPETILGFAPGVEMVRLDRMHQSDPPCYIIVNDQVRYVLDDEETRLWREVLRRIDGQRALGEILAELGTELPAVRKHLEEALDFDVLMRVARGTSDVPTPESAPLQASSTI